MNLKNKTVFVVMGVSGCGKTTLGKLLANKLVLPFYDADDFHPSRNVQKMQEGIPLQDSDRQPWLEDLAKHLSVWEQQGGAVLACSALKENYRKILANSLAKDKLAWIHLVGSYDLILNRMNQRAGHFMPPKLLQSQFDALEIPDYALEISIDQTPNEMLGKVIESLIES